MTKYSLWWTDN